MTQQVGSDYLENLSGVPSMPAGVPEQPGAVINSEASPATNMTNLSDQLNALKLLQNQAGTMQQPSAAQFLNFPGGNNANINLGPQGHTQNHLPVPVPPSATEAKQQICFDFTKGQCSRGISCKFSHDVNLIIRVNSQEKGICFDYLKGTCQRGVLCRFSHDLQNLQAPLQQMQQMMQAQPSSAATYAAAQAATVAPRRHLAPICYDFVKGQCMRGDECKYSHDYASILFGPSKQTKDPFVVCVDFTRGRCLRGATCKYRHDNPVTNAAVAAAAAAAAATTQIDPALLAAGLGGGTNFLPPQYSLNNNNMPVYPPNNTGGADWTLKSNNNAALTQALLASHQRHHQEHNNGYKTLIEQLQRASITGALSRNQSDQAEAISALNAALSTQQHQQAVAAAAQQFNNSLAPGSSPSATARVFQNNTSTATQQHQPIDIPQQRQQQALSQASSVDSQSDIAAAVALGRGSFGTPTTFKDTHNNTTSSNIGNNGNAMDGTSPMNINNNNNTTTTGTPLRSASILPPRHPPTITTTTMNTSSSTNSGLTSPQMTAAANNNAACLQPVLVKMNSLRASASSFKNLGSGALNTDGSIGGGANANDALGGFSSPLPGRSHNNAHHHDSEFGTDSPTIQAAWGSGSFQAVKSIWDAPGAANTTSTAE